MAMILMAYIPLGYRKTNNPLPLLQPRQPNRKTQTADLLQEKWSSPTTPPSRLLRYHAPPITSAALRPPFLTPGWLVFWDKKPELESRSAPSGT